MNHSPEIDKLAAALVKVQASVSTVKKDASNPFYKSNYATLDAVWDAVRKPLTDNGLAVVQMPGVFVAEGNVASLETILLHSSGQWISLVGQAPVSKADPQGVGSVITYLRRYGLAAVTSVVPDEDDDGNAASSPAPASTPKPRKSSGGKVMPFGKHKGVPMSEVPADYLSWLKAECETKSPDKSKNIIADIEAELLRREEAQS